MSQTLSEVLEGRQPLSEQTREVISTRWAEVWPKAVAVAWRITRNTESAEEIASEALLTAMRKRNEFEGRGGASWSTWVVGIARNLALNRARRATPLLDEELLAAWTPRPEDPRPRTVLEELSQAERVALVRRVAAEVLTPREQEIVDWRYAENSSYETIGRLLVPEASRNEIRAALVRIKRHLEPALQLELARLGHGTSFVRTGDIE